LGSSKNIDIVWTGEALQSLERAPFFLRGMVRKLAEKKALEKGVNTITAEMMAQWKNEAMGGMGGEGSLKDAADAIEKGQLPWTQAAKERLSGVPEFMRSMVQRIAEDVARERGHMEVNVELLEKVEALGEIEDSSPHEEMVWTDSAMALLNKKIENTPPMATEFVLQMLKHDAEDLVRGKGLKEMTEEALSEAWDVPKDEVKWSEEAWTRLQTSPDFVRSGIRKAAERRARKMGAEEITSELLTRFRNEAMMKAVLRIRKLGFRELTFDAFEEAQKKVSRLKGNEQAEKRLVEIKNFMTKKPEMGVLGEDLMQRFRSFLKDGGKLSVEKSENPSDSNPK